MNWGMENRLRRILDPSDDRTVMLAVDHGYFLGPLTGLERLDRTLEPLLPHADCLMITRGALRRAVPPATRVPVMLRMSGGTSIASDEAGTSRLSNETLTCDVEDAIRLGAAGITASIFVGTEHERQTLANLTALVDAGERWGIPVMAVTAVGRQMARDLRYLSLASRIAVELGAHMVKTYWCDGFEKLVDACPVPVVIAGGKKVPERDALELARRAVDAGAAGVDMGRNIFQSAAPAAMIRAVRAIVHDGLAVDEAWTLVEPELAR